MTIKQVMEKYSVHQKDIANMIGLTEGAVSRIVNGDVDLRVKHAKRIAAELGFEWTELFEEETKTA